MNVYFYPKLLYLRDVKDKKINAIYCISSYLRAMLYLRILV